MRFLKNILIVAFLGLLLAAGINTARQAGPILKGQLKLLTDNAPFYQNQPLSSEPPGSRANPAVTKVSPSVVSIYGITRTGQDISLSEITNPVARRWLTSIFPSLQQEDSSDITQISAGSGFFVDSSGYILTNRHVVSDTSASYSVKLPNGEQKPAAVVYRDPDIDLAIVQIEGQNYPSANLGDSSKLKIGQTVLSIGNAYGRYPNTVTQGAITSLRQIITAEDEGVPESLNVLQSSAQLYPGDSGGPLFDTDGNIIGINTAIASTEDHVSFSIPINNAKNIIQNIINGR